MPHTLRVDMGATRSYCLPVFLPERIQAIVATGRGKALYDRPESFLATPFAV